jgi:tellurite resistance protein TehA-like permease
MSVRLLQNGFAVCNCLFGLLLLALYGPALMHTRVWPPSLEQQVLLLVVGSVVPLAILAIRFPLVAGIAQFSTAFIGNQLLHESPLPGLRAFSSVSRTIAMAILFVAVFAGILEITQEAFGEIEDSDEKRATGAA